ncbi:LysM peptidoglycan-binding domain-containing protein [bacterium]|nr:LysM peptidoglycan-binding domain-containing protein [bacterium]
MREKSLKRLLFTITSFIISVNCCNSVFANTSNKTEEEEEIFSSNPNLFIPSALRNTPEYEIEIVSPENIIEEEVINEEVKTQPTTTKTITVKKGDTLYSIAQSENIKVYDLAEFNKLSSPYILKIGQIITIPNKEKTETTKITKTTTNIITNLDKNKSFIEEPKVDFVVIKKGDTIYSIAKNNNVPLKDLIIRNNLIPPYTLAIGQKIYIPNTAFHIVQKEDTVYSISRKYNVNLNSLAKLNNLKDPFTIIAGQKIILPAPNVDVKLTQKEKALTQTTTPKPVEQTTKPTTPQTQAQTEIKTPTKIGTEIEKTVSAQKQEETKQKVNKIIVRPAPLTSQKFMWPVKGKIISEFGVKNNGKRNDGINISAPIGTKVSSVENGIVAYSGNELKGLGNLIIIKHDKDYMTIYAHNDELKVKKGDIVKRGDTIATVGKTGRVTTPQLHFEVRQKTKSINPTTILERR